MSTTAVIIINWNSGNQLRECVHSVIEHGADVISGVIVVDNASFDDSWKVDCARNDLVMIIHAGANLGFAKACNLAASRCDSKYLLFLNPDARLMQGTLQQSSAFLDSREGVEFGICGVRLIDEVGRTHKHCCRFPSPLSLWVQRLGLTKIVPTFQANHRMSDFDHESSRCVDHVIGAYFHVRREVFERCSGFDERFFLYYEDLDFSLRAARSGWKTYYLAEVTAFHRSGGVSEQVKAHRLFYSLRSRCQFAFKHFSAGSSWCDFVGTITIELVVRLLFSVLKGDWDGLCGTLKGYRLLYFDMLRQIRLMRSDQR